MPGFFHTIGYSATLSHVHSDSFSSGTSRPIVGIVRPSSVDLQFRMYSYACGAYVTVVFTANSFSSAVRRSNALAPEKTVLIYQYVVGCFAWVSLTSCGTCANGLFLTIWEYEFLIWELWYLHRMKDSDFSRKSLVEWCVHMPSVRSGVPSINLLLTQRLLMKKGMVLQ